MYNTIKRIKSHENIVLHIIQKARKKKHFKYTLSNVIEYTKFCRIPLHAG